MQISALLTTKMMNMEEINNDIKSEYEGTEEFVGSVVTIFYFIFCNGRIL